MRTLVFTVFVLMLFTSQIISSPESALLEAAQRGDVEVVRKLVDTGVDLNVRNDIERTALIVAALNGHAEIAQILIDAGADANASDYYGKTALKW